MGDKVGVNGGSTDGIFVDTVVGFSSLKFRGFSWCFTWIVTTGRKLERSWHYERS